MLDGRPFTHVGADGGEDLLSDQGINPIHLRQIDPGQPIHRLTQVEVGLVFAAAAFPRWQAGVCLVRRVLKTPDT